MLVVKAIEQVCDGCALGKQHRTLFLRTEAYRASNYLELVHADLCGHVTLPTPGGSGEARVNKRVVHFSYKNINSSYNHGEKLFYSIVFNFFCGCMCTHCLGRGFATAWRESLFPPHCG
jgi:hypothetical protein